MGGGTQGLTKQSNLGRWKFSLRVSQTHESAGPKAQTVVSSLAQGEVSVPLVLRRVCAGTGLDLHLCRGLGAVEQGRRASPAHCSLGSVPMAKGLCTSRDPGQQVTFFPGRRHPQVCACLPWFSLQERVAAGRVSPFTAAPVPWSCTLEWFLSAAGTPVCCKEQGPACYCCPVLPCYLLRSLS